MKAWNTDPPTSGPHYGIPAIFGIYEEPLELARVVHNLEHGGIFILYGPGVPDATVDQLREFYGDHTTGTVMAPLPKLGKQFALGAWVSDGEGGNGKGGEQGARFERFQVDGTMLLCGSMPQRGQAHYANSSPCVNWITG